MPLHVLIIGGGIGGLALAHGLKKTGISFHVYEKDRTEHYRAQGYRVRIGGPALDALDYLLDEQTLANFELSCAELELLPIPEIDAESAEVVEPQIPDNKDQKPPSADRVRMIDRSAFRDVLIKSLDPSDISYDHVFERYEETPSGVIAHFAGGKSAQGTLLVGADGGSSRIRKQLLPTLEVIDTGLRCIYGKTPLTPELAAKLPTPIAKRMSVIKDRSREDVLTTVLDVMKFPRRAELEQQQILCPQDYIFWVLSGVPAALSLQDGKSQHLSSEESEEHALEVARAWHESVVPIVEQQERGQTSAFAMTSVRAGLGEWEPREHVTALGDAVHKMAPIGTGALLAMVDAASLCRMLAEEGCSKANLGQFEAEMRERANKSIGTSWMAVNNLKIKRGHEKHFGEIAISIRNRPKT